MILLCGATGDLGGRIARMLSASHEPFRVLVRPKADPAALIALGAEVELGDITDPTSLAPAMQGLDTVITTANAIGRMLAGVKNVSIRGVDRDGNVNLIEAAERGGVRRFIFVSMAGINEERAHLAPLAAAKLMAESSLLASGMQPVIVRPDKFQEVWLSPATGVDPANGRMRIFGEGRMQERHVAEDDVAELVVALATESDPPAIVEFGGPEPLSPLDVADAVESAFGVPIKRSHVPRIAMRAGAAMTKRLKPEIASLMGMALYSDTHPINWTDEPLTSRSIRPRTTTEYLTSLAGQSVSSTSNAGS